MIGEREIRIAWIWIADKGTIETWILQGGRETN
jgi:hypothetical protein